MKIAFLLALVAIVAALALAGRAMLNDGRDGKPKSNRMVRALALRVGLSIALFLFILISHQMGWIHPTGVPLGQ
ncbi:MAG: DUF2909 domain-containing protein [Burkholderiales bacterium]|nr:DUF2909 domain-containing protein [Burkholderiales bacterium]MBH2015781.1 DUF2909 domain-containing protein [Burkholderiales bacterium]